MPIARKKEAVTGVLFGLAAYCWWGVVAAYFKIVDEVAPLEILAHRIVWSVAVLIILVSATRRWGAVRRIVSAPSTLQLLSMSTLLIAGNWFVFIWAITHSRMVEASLGYFINPLVNVLLGFAFLGERLRAAEWISVTIAGVAVAWLTLSAGTFPWISIVLAISFALYGLIRKIAAVPSIEALTVETTLLLPLAAFYLTFRSYSGTLDFGHVSLSLDLFLIAAGPITAVPLIWFAAAVSRLRLTTVGLLQYISPSIQLVMAVTIFGEPLSTSRAFAFVLIWVAIVIYSVDNVRSTFTGERLESDPLVLRDS